MNIEVGFIVDFFFFFFHLFFLFFVDLTCLVGEKVWESYAQLALDEY